MGPISSKITQTKEKERRKEEKRKKAMVAVLMFIMANCWTEKVHLAVTFSRNNPAIIARQGIKQPMLSF